MNKNFDDIIKNTLSQDIKIPDSILMKAEVAFEQIRDFEEIKTVRFISLKKQLVASVAVICVLSIIIFGDSSFAKIRSFFMDEGIQKAIDHGYVQVLSENTIKNKGVVIKVDNIVADKTKMAISFTLNFDDFSKLKKVNDIMLGLTIKDDQGRPIMEEGNRNSLIGGFSTKTDVSNKDNGELKYYLEMFSMEGKIMDVKTVLLNINSITLLKQNNEISAGKIDGNWDFSLKLNDKLTNNKKVKFVAANKSDIVEFVSAEMLPTGMFIKFITNESVDESIISKVTLVDEQGNIYKPSSNAAMNRTSDGRDLVLMTFEVTSFENKEKLEMLIKDINGKNVELRLTKDTAQ